MHWNWGAAVMKRAHASMAMTRLPPLSEAVDPLCGGKIFHCPAHILLVDLRQRLANGRHVRGIQLFAHVGNAVLRQDLSIDADLVIRRRGAAGLCKGQLEIIITGKAQRTAEP